MRAYWNMREAESGKRNASEEAVNDAAT